MFRPVIIMLLIISLTWGAGVGTTGANYLKIGLGAKAPAMGENFTALADDTSAAYWNPAGITQAKGQQFDYMQMDWIADISSKTFFGIYPLSETDFIGGYYFMLDTPYDKETKYQTGTLAYDETGEKFKNSVGVIDIAYSKRISEKMSAGIGLKAINEELAGIKASGYALDAGILYKDLMPQLSVGCAVQNVPINKLRNDEDLPMTVALGAAYQLEFLNRPLSLLGDLKIPNDNDPRFGLGAEYWLADSLAGRVGYNNNRQFSFGVGLKLEGLVADYAYVPMGDLGITHRMSVGFRFNAVAEKPAVQEIKLYKPEKPVTTESIEELFKAPELEQTAPTPAAPEESKTTTQNIISDTDLFSSL